MLDRVLKGNLCLGCGLCASLAPGFISIQMNPSGFLRPVLNGELDKDIEAIIADCCPGIKLCLPANVTGTDPLWGRIVQSRVGFATDSTTRFWGASGGAISGLLSYLLKNKLVDYAIHVGVSDVSPFENKVYISRTSEDVLRLAGSRYAPSAPLINIQEILATEGGKAVFVGKPCDVAALRKFADVDASVRDQVVYYLSFFCAGVPSMKGTLRIIDSFGITADEVNEFRYRGRGWPGKTTVKCKDGRNYEMEYATSWGTILNQYLQFRCKICPDGTGEFADVSCADAWYSEDGYPDFKEKEGRSLILTRTQLGEELVVSSIDSHFISTENVNISDIAKMQPYQVSRRQGVFPRMLAMHLIGCEVPVFTGFKLFSNSIRGGIISFARHFVGMLFRLLNTKSKA